jgi:medium-chain acyl-[acyl-carrier-protein] hydrolase
MATPELCRLWFPAAARQPRLTQPKLRVLCFHNAGSAENIYTAPIVSRGKRTPNELLGWAAPAGVEILAVQLPGREARRGEPVLTSCQAVAAALLPVVAPLVAADEGAPPYVVVAHSVGTWNSFELLCLLREKGLPMPLRIFYSCFPPPDLPEAERPWTPNSALPTDAAFQQECRGWDVNEVVFGEGMWGVYKGLMRGDFSCFDQYRYGRDAEPPLGVPITSFYARRDQKVTAAMVAGWQRISGPGCDDDFEHLPIEGHHLFPYDPTAKAAWMKQIVERLQALLVAPPVYAAHLREIYPCHACSCQAIEVGHASGQAVTCGGGGGAHQGCHEHRRSPALRAALGLRHHWLATQHRGVGVRALAAAAGGRRALLPLPLREGPQARDGLEAAAAQARARAGRPALAAGSDWAHTRGQALCVPSLLPLVAAGEVGGVGWGVGAGRGGWNR